MVADVVPPLNYINMKNTGLRIKLLTMAMSVLTPIWLKGQIYTVGNEDGFSFVCAGSSGFELLLPASLQRFKADCGQQGTGIYWSFTETNFDNHVTPEKSYDGRHFFSFPCRIESNAAGFECFDRAANIGTRYYRLKIALPGAETEYSQTIATICEPAFVYIYPNPSSGLFTVNTTDFNSKIIISDVTGKQVYDQNINTTTEQINISGMKSGLYNLEIHSEKGTFRQRILITK